MNAPTDAASTIRQAAPADVPDIAEMVGELLTEIMDATGVRSFNFDLAATTGRLAEFLERERCFVFMAVGEDGTPAGFLTLYECYALYAEGAFGTIAELYVRPPRRRKKVGLRLVEQARAFGRSRGWRRLEVTTPPLPQFDRTLAFYEREGFSIAGGRKLKVLL